MGDRWSISGDVESDGGELTREVILIITGSADSGTSMEDTVHSPFVALKEEKIDRQKNRNRVFVTFFGITLWV